MAALSLAGCERRADVGAVIVSAQGNDEGDRAAPLHGNDMAGRLLTDSVAQGLVRFDATGQIESGIAERWIVTDEGRTYIFRLREMDWSDGKPMRAAQVVTILRRRLRERAHNPLLPYLSSVDSIVEMTPQVIQIELLRPRPDLLKLFAQPDMAVIRSSRPIGSGPMRIVGRLGRATRLRPIPDPNRATDEQPDLAPEDDVLLVHERAAAGIARFAARKSDLFAGGTYAEWPLLGVSNVAPASIRIDPAVGLFGLAVVRRDGFLADAGNRAAIALAIDRGALTQVFSAEWRADETLLPAALDSATPATVAPWQAVPAADRIAAARSRVAAWIAAGNAAPVVRIALPPGSGSTLLWGRIAADLYAVGIRPVRASTDPAARSDEPVDLRLIDAVAPYDSARWYLDQACQPCSEPGTLAIEAARTAPTLAERARAIAAADAALATDVAFVPIARPLRWSLVAQRLRAWEPNARAWHPLNRLRRAPN